MLRSSPAGTSQTPKATPSPKLATHHIPRSSPEVTSQTPKAASQPKAGGPAHAKILTCRDITNTKSDTPTQSWRPSTCQDPHLPGHHKHQKRHPNPKLATQHMPISSPAGTSQTPKATPQPKASDPAHAKILTCRDITNTKNGTPTQSWRPSTCQEPYLPGHHKHQKRHPNPKLATQYMPKASPAGTSQTPKAKPQPKGSDPAHSKILTCRDTTNTKSGSPTQSWRPGTCQDPHLPGHHIHLKRHPNPKLATQHMPRASPAGTSQTPKAKPQPKGSDPAHSKILTCRDTTNTKSGTPTQSWRPGTCQDPHLPGHHKHQKRHPNPKLGTQHMPRSSPEGTSQTPKAAPQPKAGDPAHAKILTCRDITNTKSDTPTQS